MEPPPGRSKRRREGESSWATWAQGANEQHNGKILRISLAAPRTKLLDLLGAESKSRAETAANAALAGDFGQAVRSLHCRVKSCIWFRLLWLNVAYSVSHRDARITLAPAMEMLVGFSPQFSFTGKARGGEGGKGGLLADLWRLEVDMHYCNDNTTLAWSGLEMFCAACHTTQGHWGSGGGSDPAVW